MQRERWEFRVLTSTPGCYLIPSSSVRPTSVASSPGPAAVEATTVTLYSVLIVRSVMSRELALAARF